MIRGFSGGGSTEGGGGVGDVCVWGGVFSVFGCHSQKGKIKKTSEEECRSSLLLPGHLGRMPRRRPDEGLERSALRVDAERDSFPLLMFGDEAMDQLFALPHRQQTVLVAVAERTLGHRLEVAGVNSSAGNRVAALTHAGVVPQTPLVQVRVGQGVAAGDPLRRVEHQHATQQVNGLVGRSVRQHVEDGQRRRFVRPPQDVGPGSFTG